MLKNPGPLQPPSIFLLQLFLLHADGFNVTHTVWKKRRHKDIRSVFFFLKKHQLHRSPSSGKQTQQFKHPVGLRLRRGQRCLETHKSTQTLSEKTAARARRRRANRVRDVKRQREKKEESPASAKVTAGVYSDFVISPSLPPDLLLFSQRLYLKSRWPVNV